MPPDSQVQKQPHPDLKSLNRLIGEWDVSGAQSGTSTFEWAEGGYFVLHRFDFVQDGERRSGVEIFGHQQSFGPAATPMIKTRLYEYLSGMTYDYTYEADPNGFRIWLGEKGSDTRYVAVFAPNGRSYTGEWTSPDGTYKVLLTRKG